MCGKTRNREDYRAELDELRLTVPASASTPTPVPKPEPPAPAPVPVEEAPPPEPVVEEPAPAAASEDGPMCTWHECDKPARPRSKYCSRNCSNKNARWRHAQRGR